MLNQETKTKIKNLSIKILKILGMYLAYLLPIILICVTDAIFSSPPEILFFPFIAMWFVLLVAPIIAGICIYGDKLKLRNSTIIAIAVITVSQTWADGMWMQAYTIPFEILLILSLLRKFTGRKLTISLILAIVIPLGTFTLSYFHASILFPITNKTISIQTCTNQIEKDGKVITPPVCTWGDYKVVDVSVSHASFSHDYMLTTQPYLEHIGRLSNKEYTEGLKKRTIKGDYAVKAWYTFDFLMPINSLTPIV